MSTMLSSIAPIHDQEIQDFTPQNENFSLTNKIRKFIYDSDLLKFSSATLLGGAVATSVLAVPFTTVATGALTASLIYTGVKVLSPVITKGIQYFDLGKQNFLEVDRIIEKISIQSAKEKALVVAKKSFNCSLHFATGAAISGILSPFIEKTVTTIVNPFYPEVNTTAINELKSALTKIIFSPRKAMKLINDCFWGPIISGPIVEEIICRKLIQDLLFDRLPQCILRKFFPGKEMMIRSRYAQICRVALAAIIFSLMHTGNHYFNSLPECEKITLLLSTLTGGIFLGILKESLGLSAAIGGHMFHNLMVSLHTIAELTEGGYYCS